MLRLFTVPARSQHTATVVFLHGLGDTGAGWASILAEIAAPHIKFLCPTAPVQPVTINMGLPCNSWYDIKGLESSERANAADLERSAALVREMLDKEIAAGVPANRIVLGGFSQGGALTLHTGLSGEHKLAGLMALSSYVPNKDIFPDRLSEHAKSMPVLVCHGKDDDVVQHSWGKASHELLQSFGVPSEFKDYNFLGHSSCPQVHLRLTLASPPKLTFLLCRRWRTCGSFWKRSCPSCECSRSAVCFGQIHEETQAI
eukprot:m.73737 g.73737  ORF g.73737 m.73737 type:complete len:258 (-) comp8040_c0_seq1:22-795(-)